jgi:hypothetical protein
MKFEQKYKLGIIWNVEDFPKTMGSHQADHAKAHSIAVCTSLFFELLLGKVSSRSFFL